MEQKRSLKILSIGNSYSQDAQRYLHGIARADGRDIKAVNLYIGGCSLERHYRNMLSEERAYSFEINGISNTGIKISMKEALLSDEWDIITVQQQSMRSCDIDTFSPYLQALRKYIDSYCPKASVYLMKTWGYREGSERMNNAGYATHKDMFEAVDRTMSQARELCEVCGVIPLGNAVLSANEIGAQALFRDEIHMSRGFGRYLLGLVLYGTLTDRPIENNTFHDFDIPMTDEEIALAKKIASEVLKK